MRTPIPLWRKTPALRLLLPFALGIWAQEYLQLPLPALLAGSAIALLSTIIYWMPLKQRYRLHAFGGAGFTLLLLFAGALLLHGNDVLQRSSWIGHKPQEAAVLLVLDAPEEKAATWKVRCRVVGTRTPHGWAEASGEAYLYLRKDSALQLPQPGQQLLLTKPLQRITNSGNPGAFAYAGWCRRQGITHSAFVKGEELVWLDKTAEPMVQKILRGSRDWLLDVLRRYLPAGPECGLAEALLLGYKNDLDKELAGTYSRTGVVHIIAISGMHLALVYGLLMGLTWPLRASRLRWWRTALVLSGLWAFSLMVGGGPSVLRAAVMFSFLAVGALIGRKGNSLNTLLLSALVLLVIDPFWLWDVGFQLSFTAVGGILLFYRPVYRLLLFENRLLDAAWKCSAVTLAAQVLTTPLTLYHFHQFPLLFLIANLVAVPLSGLLVYILLLLPALAWWPAAATAAGKLAFWGIGALNRYIAIIDSSPLAVWEGISINAVQVLLLYGIIAFVGWTVLQRERLQWRPAAACLLLFLGLRAWSFYQSEEQARLVVYQVPRLSAIEVQEGRAFAFTGDRQLLEEAGLLQYHINPAHTQFRLLAPGALLPAAFQSNGKIVLRLDAPAALPRVRKADILILSHRPRLQPAQLLQGMQIGTLILDASVPRATAARWRDACAREGIRCHDVSTEGAYVQEL